MWFTANKVTQTEDNSRDRTANGDDETVSTAFANDTRDDTSSSSKDTMDEWMKILQEGNDAASSGHDINVETTMTEAYLQQHQKHQQRRRTYVAMAWFGGTVGIIGGLTAPFVFTRTILPYMATPKTNWVIMLLDWN